MSYAANTIKQRGQELARFVAFCDVAGVEVVAGVTREVLERYRLAMHEERRLSAATQHTCLVTLRHFFAYLIEQRIVDENPAAELAVPRRPRPLPRDVLSAHEVGEVLGIIDMRTELGLRDRALFEVLYSTGIRRAELRGLSINDIDQARGTLLVRLGKGKKDRVVPIGERALAWVQKWVEEARPRFVFHNGEPALFVSSDGAPLSNNRLSQIVKDAIDGSGVEKKGSCHLFRHTAATLMLERGADIRFIQAMLGHELLSTTEIYTRVAIRKLQEVHRETHPSAKLERAARLDDDDEPPSL